MPWGDGTGPWWVQGRTGWWWCWRRYVFSLRRSFRQWLYTIEPTPLTKEQEIEILKEEQELIKQDLKEIEARLKELTKGGKA